MFRSYATFEIIIGPPEAEGYALIARTPGGDARSTLVLPTDNPAYQALSERLTRLELDQAGIAEFGQFLFRALFQGPVKEVYARSQGALQPEQALRLRLHINLIDAEVAALPWEFLYDPERGPLALHDVAIMRYVPAQTVEPTPVDLLPLRVLLTAAQTPPPVDVVHELQAVQTALQGLGTDVEIVLEPHLTVNKLQRLLRLGRFHIWHFVGHGGVANDGVTGALCLEDEIGDTAYITAPELAILLDRSDVRLAVLDACGGDTLRLDPLRSIAPALVRAHVAAVVVYQFSVPVETTRVFATEFYQALVEGFPIDACVTEGRKAVMLSTGLTRPDWGIPIVYTRSLTGKLFAGIAEKRPPTLLLRGPGQASTDVPNPFGKTGRIADPADFFGREELLRQLFEALGHGHNRALVGESQIGKSSILTMVYRLGPERIGRAVNDFIYLDMQLIYDEGDFFEALCDSLNISACRGYKLARTLRERRIILCLDEIEKMTRSSFTGDERTELRGLADGDDAPLTLLIASRVPLDQLFPDTPGTTSPLANICRSITVPPFTPTEVRAFVAQRLRNTGITFGAAELDQLVLQSAGKPALVQQLAAEMFERYWRGSR